MGMGQRLPFEDGGCNFVLIQHSLMYAPVEMYGEIFTEIKRVLCRGGTILIKEDNAENYVWRRVGRCGVKSNNTPRSVSHFIHESGLEVKALGSIELMQKYGWLINRWNMVKNGKAYLIEAVKT